MRFHPIGAGETIFPGERVKEFTKIENGKKITVIDEKLFMTYKFNKQEWSRPEATQYINSLSFRNKTIKHSESFWCWKLELDKETK